MKKKEKFHARVRKTKFVIYLKGEKMKLLSTVLGTALFAMACTASAGDVLKAVKDRGHVLCGVNTSAPGFAALNSKGEWEGLDVNVCRSVAAAVLGDADKVKYVPLNSPQRFTALQSGEIDILARNTTWNMTRDASQGSVFVAVTYYDGQGFMVPKALNIKDPKELDGATVCVQTGTSSEKTLAEYFKANKMTYKTVVFDTTEATQSAFISGRCDAYTTDMSDLAGARLRAGNSDEFVILPTLISKEPLGPAVRRGDDEWFQIVRWSIAAMMEAEELGITQKNVDELKKTSQSQDVMRLVGTGEDMGRMLGLDKEWSYRIVKQVGNYGESWRKYFGPQSPLNLPRGLNRTWKEGGLMYAPPIR